MTSVLPALRRPLAGAPEVPPVRPALRPALRSARAATALLRRCALALACVLYGGSAMAAGPVRANAGLVVAADAASPAPGRAIPGCPEYTGLLDSVSVPIEAPINLRVVTSVAAPAGGATFRIASDAPGIVAAGDPRQALAPTVTVPAGQTASNPFRVFGITVGSTTLRATSLTSGFTGFALPIGAWDANRGGTEKFVDPNPPTTAHCRAADDSPDLSTSPARLATCGVTARVGIATDGVSRLLLRSVSGLPGTMCWDITSAASPSPGTLGTAVATSVAQSGRNYGFSVYRSPDAMESTADSRDVEFEFVFTPSIGNGNTSRFRARTKLVRPPVLLVHGIWSSAEAWTPRYVRETEWRTTLAADYGGTAGAPFSDNAALLPGFVDTVLTTARAKGHVVTQVDVIAHSMGGLLTRLHAAGDGYLSPATYGKGNVRRLVTAATPHEGSPFPNLVATLRNVAEEDTDAAVRTITENPPTGGALCNLAENSPALQALSAATQLRSAALTATGGPGPGTFSPGVARFWGGRFGARNFEGTLTEERCIRRNMFFVCEERAPVFPQDVVNSFRFRTDNDSIVPVGSQRGGLGAANRANYATLLHAGSERWGVPGIILDDTVAQQAYTWLDGPASDMAASFPGVSSTGDGVPATVPGNADDAQDRRNYELQCGAGGPLAGRQQGSPAPAGARRPVARAIDPRVRITSPAAGTVVAPGSRVTVQVAIDGPLPLNDFWIVADGFGNVAGGGYNGNGYQAVLDIPDSYVGALSLEPVVTDSANTRLRGSPIPIVVRDPATPSRVALRQKVFNVPFPGRATQGRLVLDATYPSGTTRNVSAGVLGTTHSSSDPAVVTVDADGRWSAVAAGVASVTSTHAGLSDTATFVVSDPRQSAVATNVTGSVSVLQGGFQLDRVSGAFVQRVTVQNRGTAPLAGPLFLVVGNLGAGITLINASGTTQSFSAGTPYVTLPLGGNGLTLPAGGGTEVFLRFLNPSRTPVVYNASVVRSAASP